MSGCNEQSLPSRCCAMASHCSAFSGCRTWAPEHASLNSFMGAQLPLGMWTLLGPGIEPIEPNGRLIIYHWANRDISYSLLLENDIYNIHVGAKYVQLKIHGNIYVYSSLPFFPQLTFEHIQLKVICDDVCNLIHHDVDIVAFPFVYL